jgi:hypothetical protein
VHIAGLLLRKRRTLSSIVCFARSRVGVDFTGGCRNRHSGLYWLRVWTLLHTKIFGCFKFNALTEFIPWTFVGAVLLKESNNSQVAISQ